MKRTVCFKTSWWP